MKARCYKSLSNLLKHRSSFVFGEVFTGFRGRNLDKKAIGIKMDIALIGYRKHFNNNSGTGISKYMYNISKSLLKIRDIITI